MKKAVLAAILLAGGFVLAQTNQDDSLHSKKQQITVRGCVARSSGHFMLMQTDPGNSYVLETAAVDISQYLGQEVEVIGSETHSQSNSSHATREGAGSSLGIHVDSINTISQKCTH